MRTKDVGVMKAAGAIALLVMVVILWVIAASLFGMFLP